MDDNSNNRGRVPFPRIKTGILNRLSDEADQRTIRPEVVDWEEIQRQAAEARKKMG